MHGDRFCAYCGFARRLHGANPPHRHLPAHCEGFVELPPQSAPPVKDSGQRVQHETGAVRDSAKGRGRYDLISPIFLERLAKHLEAGAEKYEERNWEKGLPICRAFASMWRHASQAFQRETDEDHMAAVACNAMFILHTLEMVKRGVLPASLDNRPDYRSPAGGKPDRLDGKLGREHTLKLDLELAQANVKGLEAHLRDAMDLLQKRARQIAELTEKLREPKPPAVACEQCGVGRD